MSPEPPADRPVQRGFPGFPVPCRQSSGTSCWRTSTCARIGGSCFAACAPSCSRTPRFSPRSGPSPRRASGRSGGAAASASAPKRPESWCAASRAGSRCIAAAWAWPISLRRPCSSATCVVSSRRVFLAKKKGVSSRRGPAVLEVLLLHGAGRVSGAHERRQPRVRAHSVRAVLAGRGDRGLRADDAGAAGAAAAVQRAAHAEPAERAVRRGRQLPPRLREHVSALQPLPLPPGGRST